MNRNINNYNEKEIKNKLKNFKEGADYSVSPTEEPEIKTFSFFNDELKSWFRGDRVPIRVTKEAYDGKDYTYRGHFEEGKDYYYSQQTWVGNVPADTDGWHPIWKGEERFSDSSSASWSLRSRPLIKNNEPKKIEPTGDLKWKHNQLIDRLNSLLARPESDFGVNGKWKKESEIAEVRNDIADIERLIEKEKGDYNNGIQQRGRTGREEGGKDYNFNNQPAGCCCCGFKDINLSDTYCQKCGAKLCDEAKKPAKSDLEKENYELKKQLAEVKSQLVKVLEELKKLRNNSTGQNNAELDQQINYNEKLISNGEKVSETEIKEQVQKSQDLLKKNSVSVVPTKDNSGSGALPYVIGGSVLVVGIAAIVGYYLWNSKGKNKTS